MRTYCWIGRYINVLLLVVLVLSCFPSFIHEFFYPSPFQVPRSGLHLPEHWRREIRATDVSTTHSHRHSDRCWRRVSRLTTFRPQRSRHQELSCRQRDGRENRRLRHVSRRLQHRLLQGTLDVGRSSQWCLAFHHRA